MQSFLDSLQTLPSGILYPILLAVAAIENFLPPFPADVVFAFGTFVAAQGHHSMALVFASAWVGNLIGAMTMYRIGLRYGAERVEQRIAGKGAAGNADRFQKMFKKYGLTALFLARFVPGVRSLVPAAAGALKVPAFTTAAMVGGAAGIWYGVITVVAYRVGADWDELKEGIAEFSKTAGIGAVAILALGLVVWAVVRTWQSRR